MKTYRDRYIEMHSLEFDFYNSACGECEYGLNNDCQYYKNKCPNGDKND